MNFSEQDKFEIESDLSEKQVYHLQYKEKEVNIVYFPKEELYKMYFLSEKLSSKKRVRKFSKIDEIFNCLEEYF